MLDNFKSIITFNFNDIIILIINCNQIIYFLLSPIILFLDHYFNLVHLNIIDLILNFIIANIIIIIIRWKKKEINYSFLMFVISFNLKNLYLFN